MKKITLSLVALFAAFVMQAQVEVVLTQNVGDTVTDSNGIACPTGDNHWGRLFPLSDYNITEDLFINSVSFGVQSLNVDTEVIVSVYELDGNPVTGTFTLLGSGTVDVSAGDVFIQELTFDEAIVVPAGTGNVFIEVEHVNDAEGAVMFMAGTADETAEPWLKSVTCGLSDFTNPAEIEFEDANLYIIAKGDTILSTNDYLLSQVSVYPNPASDVINISLPASVEVVSATLFDILGKNTGVTLNNGAINIASLAKGVYMLNIETNQGNITKKIMKR